MGRLPEISFDISEGRLIIGEAAHEEVFSQYQAMPDEIVRLSSLLIDENFPFDVNSFTRLECGSWEREDYVSYGKWILSLVNEGNEEPERPTRTHFRRAYYLGLGPYPKKIAGVFGSQWEFNDAIESPGGQSAGRFDSWTSADFVAYGMGVSGELEGKRPLKDDFLQRFRDGKGPSPNMIARRMGSLNAFSELLGFPNIRGWTDEDYIDWGVRLLEANPGMGEVSRYVLDGLSQQKKGPSTGAVLLHFGKLSNYVGIIREEFQSRMQQQKLYRENRVKVNLELVQKGLIPADLFDGSEGDIDGFLSLSARFNLVDNLLPGINDYKKKLISRVQPKSLISSIRNIDPSLSAGVIETQATKMGIFDDIWPMNDYLEQLKVAA